MFFPHNPARAATIRNVLSTEVRTKGGIIWLGDSIFSISDADPISEHCINLANAELSPSWDIEEAVLFDGARGYAINGTYTLGAAGPVGQGVILPNASSNISWTTQREKLHIFLNRMLDDGVTQTGAVLVNINGATVATIDTSGTTPGEMFAGEIDTGLGGASGTVEIVSQDARPVYVTGIRSGTPTAQDPLLFMRPALGGNSTAHWNNNGLLQSIANHAQFFSGAAPGDAAYRQWLVVNNLGIGNATSTSSWIQTTSNVYFNQLCQEAAFFGKLGLKLVLFGLYDCGKPVTVAGETIQDFKNAQQQAAYQSGAGYYDTEGRLHPYRNGLIDKSDLIHPVNKGHFVIKEDFLDWLSTNPFQ